MRSEENAPRNGEPTFSWFLLHDNAPAHRSVFVKDFLANTNVTTLQHQPYSPDPAPVDFQQLLRLRSALNGRRFCDGTDTIKNATEELKKLWQNGFQECFQQLYIRSQKCFLALVDYFERNVA